METIESTISLLFSCLWSFLVSLGKVPPNLTYLMKLFLDLFVKLRLNLVFLIKKTSILISVHHFLNLGRWPLDLAKVPMHLFHQFWLWLIELIVVIVANRRLRSHPVWALPTFQVGYLRLWFLSVLLTYGYSFGRFISYRLPRVFSFLT